MQKHENTTKSTKAWLDQCLAKWANGRKFDPKLEPEEYEDLDKRPVTNVLS